MSCYYSLAILLGVVPILIGGLMFVWSHHKKMTKGSKLCDNVLFVITWIGLILAGTAWSAFVLISMILIPPNC